MDEHSVSQTTRATRAVDSKLELERQYILFAVFSAVASLLTVWFRFEANAFVTDSSWFLVLQIGTVVSAISVLVRPTWTLPFFVLNLIHVAFVSWAMPFITSADFLWLFFALGVVASFLSGWVISRSYAISAIGLYRSVAPCLRIMTLIAIVAMAVARVNTAFVSLETSPITPVVGQFFSGDEVSPGHSFDVVGRSWTTYLMMSAFVIVDVLLAVALVVPSLRRFAVGFGTVYFSVQSVLGLGETRILLPLLVVGLSLFVSPALIGRISSLVRRWLPWSPRIVVSVIATCGLLFLAMFLGNQNPANDGKLVEIASNEAAEFSRWIELGHAVKWCYAALLVVWGGILLSSLIDARPRLTWVSMMLRNPLHFVVLLLMLIATASPYLGLGNVGRFTEGSGLYTAGMTNHLLVPHHDVASLEGDLVELVSSSDPYLQELADRQLSLTWFDFVNYVVERPETRVEFIKGEDLVEVERTGGVAELSSRNNWLSAKLCTFVPISRTRVPIRSIARQ